MKYRKDKKIADKLDKETRVLAKELKKSRLEKRWKRSEKIRKTALKTAIK